VVCFALSPVACAISAHLAGRPSFSRASITGSSRASAHAVFEIAAAALIAALFLALRSSTSALKAYRKRQKIALGMPSLVSLLSTGRWLPSTGPPVLAPSDWI
jgi:hypothetical protein